MELSAVVYTSNTGHTRRYAELLGEKTGLPVYELKAAVSDLPAGRDVIYLGWLMADKVQGCRKATSRFNVAAICGVGIGASGSRIQEVRRANAISGPIPVFTLQGGFDMKRLRGIHRLMMTLMIKSLAGKAGRTPDEEALLELARSGGDRVSIDELRDVMDWYRIQK